MNKQSSFGLRSIMTVIMVVLLTLMSTSLVILAQSDNGEEGEGIGIATEDPNAPTDLPEPESVWNIAWSPDGTQLAIASSPSGCDYSNNNYTTHIVDAITRQNIITLNSENYCPVINLEWSPDGKYILIGTAQGGGVWQIATGHLMSIIHAVDSPNILDYDWSPRGNRIVTIERDYPDIHIWDALGNDGVYWVTENNPNSVEWSPDSKQLAVLDSELRILDSTTGEIIAELPAHGGKPTWSPDGSKFAGIDAYNNILISNSRNGDLLKTLSGHTDQLTAIKWRPDGKAIASASADGTVRVWDTETGSQIEMFTHSGPVYALDWNPLGTQLVYGGAGSTDVTVITPKSIPMIQQNQ